MNGNLTTIIKKLLYTNNIDECDSINYLQNQPKVIKFLSTFDPDNYIYDENSLTESLELILFFDYDEYDFINKMILSEKIPIIPTKQNHMLIGSYIYKYAKQNEYPYTLYDPQIRDVINVLIRTFLQYECVEINCFKCHTISDYIASCARNHKTQFIDWLPYFNNKIINNLLNDNLYDYNYLCMNHSYKLNGDCTIDKLTDNYSCLLRTYPGSMRFIPIPEYLLMVYGSTWNNTY